MKKEINNSNKKNGVIHTKDGALLGPKTVELISTNAKGPFLFAWHKGKGPRVSTFYIRLIAAMIDDFVARLSVDKLRNAWQGHTVGDVDVRIGTRDLDAASLRIEGLPEELQQRSEDLAAAIAGSSIAIADYVESSFLLSELGRIAWFLSQKSSRTKDSLEAVTSEVETANITTPAAYPED